MTRKSELTTPWIALVMLLAGCTHDLDSVALPCTKNADCPNKGQQCVSSHCQMVDGTDNPGKNISLALNAQGEAFIAYTNKAPGAGQLVLATNYCGTWKTLVVDTKADHDFGTTMAEVNGVVHIAYYNTKGMDLMYATICPACP